ncbi:hypothetical protein [Carboxydothermus pertinax]|uniref:Lipoprotein n=1 Tax=Carboxydothermus pertinax TaxID=870242 RepID=A0A1L8CTL6_9THEO|nr:hypothetical protein [Carboxydothermus pertinax]GAV22261.1 hypothetical protein cpu_07710 [Carboxydothermus pertinax]
MKKKKIFLIFILGIILLLSTACSTNYDENTLKSILIKEIKENILPAENIKVVLLKKFNKNEYVAICNYDIVNINYEDLVQINIKYGKVNVYGLGGGIGKTSPDQKMTISSTSYDSEKFKFLMVYGTVFDKRIAKVKVVYVDGKEEVSDVSYESDLGGYLFYRENYVKGFKRVEAYDKNGNLIERSDQLGG